MSDKIKLAELNKKIGEANRALDKWGPNSDKGKVVVQELKSLKAEKSQLPASLLRQEKIDIATKSLEGAVHRVRKYPDIALNRQDIKTHSEELLELGIPQSDIDAIVGDILDEKDTEATTISSQEAQQKLQQLTTHVKTYLDDLSFKAELDSSYQLPDDIVAEVNSWGNDETDKPLNTAQNKIMRTINALREGQVTETRIHTALRAGQSST